MSIKTENTIKLRDGRTLGYAEYGDPNGRPVLHFHGFPSSRYEGFRTEVDEIADRRVQKAFTSYKNELTPDRDPA